MTAYSDFSVTQGANISAGNQNANMVNFRQVINGTDATAAPIGGLTPLIKASSGLYENAIINPIDENMVDQYQIGNGVITGSDPFVVDRWHISDNQTSRPTFTKNTDNIENTNNESTNTVNRFVQKIEDVNYKRLDGKQVIFSIPIIATITTGALKIALSPDNGTTWYGSSSHTGGGAEETLSITVSAANMTGLTGVIVTAGFFDISGTSLTTTSCTSGDTFQIKNAKLELGSTATPYKPRHYGEELALCQRYAVKLSSEGNDTILATGFADSQSSVRLISNYPVEMRDVYSSVTFSNGGTAFEVVDGVTATSITSNTPSLGQSGRNYLSFSIGVSGTPLTQYRPYEFRVKSTSAYILVLAEL